MASRSTFPIIVAAIDWAWLGRELPSRRTLCAMLGIVASTAAYAHFERGVLLHRAEDALWLVLWAASCIFQAREAALPLRAARSPPERPQAFP